MSFPRECGGGSKYKYLSSAIRFPRACGGEAYPLYQAALDVFLARAGVGQRCQRVGSNPLDFPCECGGGSGFSLALHQLYYVFPASAGVRRVR